LSGKFLRWVSFMRVQYRWFYANWWQLGRSRAQWLSRLVERFETGPRKCSI
jgi:hypothetical protein